MKLTKDDFRITFIDSRKLGEISLVRNNTTEMSLENTLEQILENQEKAEKWDGFLLPGLLEVENMTVGDFRKVLSDAKLCNELVEILLNHAGETGKNEGAVDCVKRLSNSYIELKKKRQLYIEENQRCISEGLNGTRLHYEAIIEAFDAVLGYEHDWEYIDKWKRCRSCQIVRWLTDKEIEALKND